MQSLGALEGYVIIASSRGKKGKNHISLGVILGQHTCESENLEKDFEGNKTSYCL